MSSTRKDWDWEFEILLRPTTRRIGEIFFGIFTLVGGFIIFSLVLFETHSRTTRGICIWADLLFFPASVWALYFGILGLHKGKIQLGVSDLIIDNCGKSKTLSYNEISSIILTKAMQYKSLQYIVVFELKGYRLEYIYNNYEETPEDIFAFLKREFNKRHLPIKFCLRPRMLLF